MIDCFIDSRETKRLAEAEKYFKNHGFNTEVKELIVGDYVFIFNDVKVIFEYKTIEDFIDSIEDNRVFNQALNQSNKYDFHFVVIVGSDNDYETAIIKHTRHTKHYIGLTNINGSIASLVEFTSILQVKSQDLAFDLMERVAIKCLRDKPIIHRFPKSRGSPAYRFLVNNVNGIADKTAKNICEDLDLWSLLDVLELNVNDLIKVRGIGRKKAENILLQIVGMYS